MARKAKGETAIPAPSAPDVGEDGHALWRLVTADVEPYHPVIPAETVPPPPDPAPAPKAPSKVKRAKAVQPAPLPAPKPPAPPPRLAHGAAPSVDRRTATRLKRGRMVPEAELDLHGYGRERGRDAVIDFILGAQQRGLRCVRIVTGKGGEGVMRRSLPGWLNEAPLRPVVLMFDHAPQAEGGIGAVHILLKRIRDDRE